MQRQFIRVKGVSEMRDISICRWNPKQVSAPHALEDDTRAVMNDHPNPRAETARAIVTITRRYGLSTAGH
jgi:hypothetical protein